MTRSRFDDAPARPTRVRTRAGRRALALVALLLVAGRDPARGDDSIPPAPPSGAGDALPPPLPSDASDAPAGADAAALFDAARLRRQEGDLGAAISMLRRALALRERGTDARATAKAARALGLVLEQAGSFDEARDAQGRALALSDADGDAAGTAAALGNLGGIAWRVGDYAASLSWQERALELLVRLKDRRREAATLCNLGAVYQRIGDGDRALSCYERAAARLTELCDPARLATVLSNSGALYAARGEPERALSYLERAREAAEASGDRAVVAAALAGEGYAHASLNQCDEAERAHARSLALFEALSDREGMAEARTALGLVRASRGDPEGALARLRAAVDGAETIGARDALVVALWASATVRLQLGEPAEAMAAARRAIEEMPALVSGLCDEHGALVRQRLAPVFETGLRAAATLGDLEQATYFLESGRAGALIEALGGRDRLHDTLIPASLRAAESQARAEESRALGSYRRALDAEDLVGARAGRAAYEAARQGVRLAIERIQREAKGAAHLVYPRVASLAELRAGLAGDEALVTYAVLPDRALALVVTRAGARLVPLGATEDVDAACKGLSALTSPGPTPGDAIDAMRRLVVEPLALSPRITRVLVSPDGALAYVPFPVVFEGREVVCVPSGTTWQLLDGESTEPGVGVLALGDPDYETDGPGANRLARMQSGVGFPMLPYTRDEVKAVGDVVLVGADATEAGLRYAISRRPRWRAVHLACHGIVDTDAPLLSSLALTPSGDDDGFLTAMDVLRSRIPTDLAVLSACRTGRGKVVRGEGVMGFVRAFMFAGAPRVVVSLWNGDDEATKTLMTRFHLGLRQGRPTAAALAEAQAFVRGRDAWKHPYYWAGWVLWGLRS